ncbi:hypothetical protein CCACVL1_19194 [Corchorus capsularis]|uniref:Uncharacterized protein n=1 Tax=Corchorus capsularis TaxID=210143 RepID=A0A1R3HHS7_COCAP|nr:hypothetical protein CCACVL1_19194 [Corchorus capsularis]
MIAQSRRSRRNQRDNHNPRPAKNQGDEIMGGSRFAALSTEETDLNLAIGARNGLSSAQGGVRGKSVGGPSLNNNNNEKQRNVVKESLVSNKSGKSKMVNVVPAQRLVNLIVEKMGRQKGDSIDVDNVDMEEDGLINSPTILHGESSFEVRSRNPPDGSDCGAIVGETQYQDVIMGIEVVQQQKDGFPDAVLGRSQSGETACLGFDHVSQ